MSQALPPKTETPSQGEPQRAGQGGEGVFGWFLSHVARRRWFLERAYGRRNAPFLKFVTPGHYYSPLPDGEAIHRDAAKLFDRSRKELPGIDLQVESQLARLREWAPLHDATELPAEQTPGRRWYAKNGYFTYGDAVVLACILRATKPRRVVELGSGFSSALMLDVDQHYLDGQTQWTFIDPDPSRIDELLRDADRSRATILQKLAQDLSPEWFDQLEAGDILFIDSSHVGKIGSDVLYLFFEILPRLKPGVLIHVHDILWPFEYPQVWLERGRAWNEAYFLRALLMHQKAYEIYCFGSYLETHHRDALSQHLPKSLADHGIPTTPGFSSIWLKKTAG
jgi:predicted O-methyltransferase YrrM